MDSEAANVGEVPVVSQAVENGEQAVQEDVPMMEAEEKTNAAEKTESAEKTETVEKAELPEKVESVDKVDVEKSGETQTPAIVSGVDEDGVRIRSQYRLHLSCKDFKYLQLPKLQTWLEKVSPVPFADVVKQQTWLYAFVSFSSQEDLDKFRVAVDKLKFKNKEVWVKEAKASEKVAKRPREEEGDVPSGKVSKKDPETLADIRNKKHERGVKLSLRERTTPLAKYTYDEQLTLKWRFVRNGVRQLTREVRRKSELEKLRVPAWSTVSKNKTGCPVLDCIPSPESAREGYRNKCEFTIGTADGQPRVGFVNTIQNFEPVVDDPTECIHVPQGMKEVAARLQEVIATSSFPVIDRKEKTGYWRILMIRMSKETKQMMIMIQTRSVENLDEMRDLLVKELVEKDGEPRLFDGIPITSMYIQINDTSCDAVDGDRSEVKHVWGNTTLDMSVCGVIFNVSPSSFFQTNLETCELLYKTALDWLDLNKERSIFLDVCCGVGTLGLCASERVKKIIGIEMVPEAVENAKANALRNNVPNAEYHVGKAEDVMPALLENLVDTKEESNDDICAMVDPPRAGLHPIIVKALRDCPQIKKLVYISCNPDSLVRDVSTLALPTFGSSDPFVPVKAIPVDMFPHTAHVEMIMLLQRESTLPEVTAEDIALKREKVTLQHNLQRLQTAEAEGTDQEAISKARANLKKSEEGVAAAAAAVEARQADIARAKELEDE